MFERLLLAHPRAVGETYVEHLRAAAAFGAELLLAGMACLVHAVLPAAFETTASRAVARLYRTMALRRSPIGALSSPAAGEPPADTC
jgi:hypothetical protein